MVGGDRVLTYLLTKVKDGKWWLRVIEDGRVITSTRDWNEKSSAERWVGHLYPNATPAKKA